MSEAKGEQESTETLSFRCDCERCRLVRGRIDRQVGKVAFTLAEVLITLGIIGIVAAMTLPSLINNYQKVVAVAKLQKSYSVLIQAIRKAEIKNGDVKTWPWNTPDIVVKDYLLPEFNGATSYGLPENWRKAMCYESIDKVYPYYDARYVWFNGGNGISYISSPFGNQTASFKLLDGTCIGLNGDRAMEFKKQVFIDINGGKGPNQAGKDLFFFIFDGNQLKPYGYNFTDDELYGTKRNPCKNGYTCAARIIREGWKIKYY